MRVNRSKGQESKKIKKGVIVVEDDPDAAYILERTLKKIDIPALATVATGEGAIEQAGKLAPDLILMDIMLQGEMDGIEAANIITERYDIPVIFLTAYTGEELIQRAATSEHYGYLLKPIDPRQLSVSIDVTMRQHFLEQQLAISRAWFQETMMGIGDSVITTNSAEKIDFINPSAEQLLNTKSKEVVGLHLPDVLEIVDSSGKKVTQKVIKTTDKAGSYHRKEYIFKSPDDSNVPVDVTVIPIISKKKMIGWVIFLQDISERKRYEEDLVKTRDDLRSYKEELQLLSNNLRSLQEKERGQISREIHDEIAQNLARIRMDIQALRGKITDEKSKELASNTSELVGECITSVRRIATELRPRILDDVGLIAAVQWQLDQIRNRYNLSIDLATDPEEFEIDPEMAVDIFRIIQESLQNVVKHANATKVSINLEHTYDSVNLEVHDNGSGFETYELTPTHSLGIVGMRERTNRWKGTFNVTSSENKGCMVKASFPYIESPNLEADYDKSTDRR